ncbi:MAG TPA: helix-turn-helix domain-containing protein [Anaerolineales bacterium]|nr:helix-turn-helix domain-containing protein [Anaerolineales bacterium]
MSFTYEEKPSSSPHVDIVWRTEDQTDGIYVASADACWDMVFIQNRAGKTKVLLSGPSSKTTQVPYSAGNKNFGVRFKPGVIFTNIPVTDMIDVTQALPMPTEDTFELQGFTRKLPTYENIDEFIAELAECGLLSHDPIVRDVLENKTVNMSARSIQRHFAMTIGLSPRRVKQITSARKAVELLLGGMSLADVAYELDYADLPHMVRMLKRFTGYTPLGNKKRGESV